VARRRHAVRSVSAIALGLVLVATGCWPFGGGAGELRDGARALVPDGGRVLLEEEGDCVELARSPSCVHVYFVTERLSLAERVDAVEAAARAESWKLDRKEVLLGATELRLRRGRLRAFVSLRADAFRGGECPADRAKDCADVVMVERGG
jgi:hypothetical protein